MPAYEQGLEQDAEIRRSSLQSTRLAHFQLIIYRTYRTYGCISIESTVNLSSTIAWPTEGGDYVSQRN